MHLWPSARLRNSFKIDYLKKLEWNLNLMKAHKKNTQSQSETCTTSSSKLLDSAEEETPNSKDSSSCFDGTLLICRELIMIVSCCYCCFCCGACVEDEES